MRANAQSRPNDCPFLNGGGEMGGLMRAFDWSKTKLGTPDIWPQSLKTIVKIVLASGFPMLIFWGPELVCFYNDAYRPCLGIDGKHPSILGQPAKKAWAEVWQIIKPLLDQVLEGGESIWREDQLVPIYRNGQMEDVYWTFSYSSLNDDNDETAGVLITCTETTGKMIAIKNLQQKNAQLQESEDRFRNMAENSEVLIAVADESGDGIYFNKAWTELTGKSEAELLKFGWTELIHPADKDQWIDTYLTAHRAQISLKGEFRILSQKGHYHCLLASIPARFRPDGSFAGYISSCIDITERKQWEVSLARNAEDLRLINAEMASYNEKLASTNEELTETNEELRRMQQQLQNQTNEKQIAIDRLNANEQNIRNMVLQAPVGMCIVAGDPLYVVEINDSFLEIIGKTREAFKLKPYWEALPEAAAFYKPIIDKVFEAGIAYHAREHEIMLIRNGKEEIVHVDFVYEPMTDFTGKPYAIMIVGIDVTDKVLARKKVERAEESLRMAIDAAGLGIYYINATDRTFVLSPRLKELFGFRPDEDVPYEAAINQIHPDYRQAAADLVEAAFTKGVRFDMEYPVVGYHDGAIRWVRGIGMMQHYDGKDFFMGVLHDITESKKDEIRKNDFIGMVSHELKTPLTSLNAIIQIASAKLVGSEDKFLVGAMSKANMQVKRMTNMINGFLNISRLESGKILIEKQVFNIDELIQEIVDEMKLTVTTHSFNISTCPAVEVNADRDKINSVISNLLSNAVKYSSKGTAIEIGCQATKDQITISVKDEGAGIKLEDLAKIFDRYYRVESSNTQHISGFGIGLYLSAEIVQRHDGQIWVESEPGKGSTFFFSLPLENK